MLSGKLLVFALVWLAAMVIPNRASSSGRVIIYDGVATQVAPAAIESPDLWITTQELTRATRFEVKPQGVCRDELCFPIPKNRKEAMLRQKASVTWFNLSEFARMLRQPVAYDEKHSTWFFGARQAAQNSFVDTLEAPNFTLPDINGAMHSLSDFRGKKVLLLTWASW
jgi:hypothetical protein